MTKVLLILSELLIALHLNANDYNYRRTLIIWRREKEKEREFLYANKFTAADLFIFYLFTYFHLAILHHNRYNFIMHTVNHLPVSGLFRAVLCPPVLHICIHTSSPFPNDWHAVKTRPTS